MPYASKRHTGFILCGVRRLCLITAVSFLALTARAADNLIVCDEVPAMQVLAGQIQMRNQESSEITSQDKLPSDLNHFRNVIVYIHRNLDEPAEMAFIAYAKEGGNLVLLHHSISSAKRKNKYWFPFLGIQLPESYKFIDDATWDMIPADGSAPFTMKNTEVYVNHVLSGDRTPLFDIRYGDKRQAIGGWVKTAEKGRVYYFMPGHKASDFEFEPYVRVLVKALK